MATIKGKWVFNEKLIFSEFWETVNFSSNATKYYKMSYYNPDMANYDFQYDESGGGDYITVNYSSDAGRTQEWQNEEYRTVDFGTTEQTVSDTFLTWMKANAEEQVEKESKVVTIDYNGAVIASIESGKTATLHCADKKMASDIVVTAPEIPEVKLQEKTICENCEVTPDEGYDGFSKVIIDVPVPDGYIDPEGTKEITENGTHDVTEFESVTINVPIQTYEVYDGMVTISDINGYDHNAPELHPSGTIPENATYTIYSTGEVLTDGATFPESIEDGDEYAYGDYKYVYNGYFSYSDIGYWPYIDDPDNKTNGWGVICINREVETPESILESINGVNVTKMKYTFEECTSLISAVIPSSVTNMERAFYNCTSLTTVSEIPECVTNMEYAFYNCTSLTTAHAILNSVTNMEYAFYNCTSLTTAPDISNATNLSNMCQTFNVCTSLKTYVGAPKGTADGDFSGYIIPNGVIKMDSTFRYCKALTTAPVIPESVTSMRYAFNNCTSLTTAPDMTNATSVTDMCAAFGYCASLKTYVGAPKGTADGDFSGYIIPNGVTDMEGTFRSCTYLTTAPVIPSSVTSIWSTFSGCTSLIGSITINATPAKYTECLKNTQITEILGSCGNKSAILATKTA